MRRGVFRYLGAKSGIQGRNYTGIILFTSGFSLGKEEKETN